MTKTLDLMVDMDEIFFPMIDSVHQLALEAGLHDGTVKPRWRGWEVYTMPDGSPCPEEVYWDLWAQFRLSGGYVSTEPIPGAVEALRWLYWEGHRIHIVTARGFMKDAEQIREWTPKYLEDFAVPHHSLTFSRNKAEAMDLLDVRFDAGIDDSPRNWAELTDAGVMMFLQNHPHNEDEARIPAEWRVDNLWEFAYRVDKLVGE